MGNKFAAMCGAALAAVLLVFAAGPEFSVASIKPSQTARAGGEGSGREHVTVSRAGVTLINASLSDCVQFGYNVRFYQVSGPDEVLRIRYDIITKADPPAEKEQLRIMMQALLVDRFRVKLHRETRTLPVFVLVAPNMPNKLRTSTSDLPATLTVEDGGFVFRHVTMAEFAERLGNLAAIDRPVLDKTGIAGVFDVTLDSAARAMLEDPQSIFGAIERIGLRLDDGKSPIEMIVIDHAEKPSPN